MPKKTKTASKSTKPLCILHETEKLKTELYQEGEGFRIHFAGAGGKDREFDSLPNLLSGLHGIFLELRMTGPGLHGLDALARASDDARQDVLAASRTIHSALDSK